MVSTKSIVLAAATLFAAASAVPTYGSSGGSTTQNQCSASDNIQCCNSQSNGGGILGGALSSLLQCQNLGTISALIGVNALSGNSNPCSKNSPKAYCCSGEQNQSGLVNVGLNCSPLDLSGLL